MLINKLSNIIPNNFTNIFNSINYYTIIDNFINYYIIINNFINYYNIINNFIIIIIIYCSNDNYHILIYNFYFLIFHKPH